MKTACLLLTALALCAAADLQYPQCKPGTFSCFVSINGARYAAPCDAYAGAGTALNGVRSGQPGAGLACGCDDGLSLSAQKFVSASNCPHLVDLSSRGYYSGRVFPPYSTVGTANAEGQIHTPSDIVFFYLRRNCGACIRKLPVCRNASKRTTPCVSDSRAAGQSMATMLGPKLLAVCR